MSDEAALFAAYADCYPDETQRQILADWLEERGDPRAAWLRDPDIGPWMGPEVADPIMPLMAALHTSEKVQATRALAKIGPAAVTALLDALATDTDNSRRNDILPTLAALCDTSPVLRPLVEQLRSTEAHVQEAAIEALGNLGEAAAPAVVYLLPLLRAESASTRSATVRTLARLGVLAPWALRMASNGLRHDDHDAMAVLHEEIVRLGPGSGVIDLVVAGLHSSDDDILESACNSLRSLGLAASHAVLAGLERAESEWVHRFHRFFSDFGVEGLRKLGEVACDRGGDVRLRRAALEVLWQGEDWNRAEYAEEIAAQLLPLLDEPDRQLLEIVLCALSRCQEKAAPAVPALLPMLTEGHPLRSAAVGLLCSIGPAARIALPLIQPLADHDDYYVRTGAVHFLKMHAAPEVTVARFREDLESADPAARARAIQNLIPFLPSLPDCADLLCRALSDPHSNVRTAGSSALGELRFPDGLDLSAPVRLALHAPESMIREHTVACLRNHADYAVQFIPEFLDLLRHDEDAQVRTTLADLFQWLPVQPPEVRDGLRDALHDPDPGVRTNAMRTLRQCRPLAPEVIQALLVELRDHDLHVMSEAARLLCQADPPPSELVSILSELLRRSPDWRTHSVLDALVHLQYQAVPEDVPYLITALRMGFGIPCSHAAQLLSRVGAPAVPALIEQLGAEQPETRRYAGIALRDIGPAAAAALPALTALLQAPDYFTRGWATPAVAAVGGAAALPELLELVRREDNPDVLQELSKALAGLSARTPAVAVRLRELAHLPEERAQKNAAELLAALAAEEKGIQHDPGDT